MSVKTTYLVTREFALAAILQKLEEAGDEQLSNILEETIHSAFHNFAIVSEEEFQKNKNAPLINAGSYNVLVLSKEISTVYISLWRNGGLVNRLKLEGQKVASIVTLNPEEVEKRKKESSTTIQSKLD